MLGETLSIGCAASWSLALILFKRTDHLPPEGLNLFKNVLATTLLAATLLGTGGAVDLDRSGEDWARLIVSGVIGIAIADTLMFVALRQIGPGLIAIVECAYSPLVVVLSILLLGEVVGPAFIAGAFLVVGGMLVATARVGVAGSHRAEGQTLGVLVGVTAISLMALGIVLAKPALDRSELIEVTFIRLAAGVVGQSLWTLTRRKGRAALSVFRPQRAWRTLVPASILAGYLAMIMWLGGTKYTDASTAAVLNQTSTVFTLVLARVVLGEVLTPRRATGGALAFAGAVVIILTP